MLRAQIAGTFGAENTAMTREAARALVERALGGPGDTFEIEVLPDGAGCVVATADRDLLLRMANAWVLDDPVALGLVKGRICRWAWPTNGPHGASLDDPVDLDIVGSRLRFIPDFPKPGINFCDITPILADRVAFLSAIDLLKWAAIERLPSINRPGRPDFVVGLEARGFIFGAALAFALGVGFVPARKPGKLPAATVSETYDLEYGSNALEIHADAIPSGARVLIVDDLLATGGTARAACNLVRRLGGRVVGALFLVELKELAGRQQIDCPVHALFTL